MSGSQVLFDDHRPHFIHVDFTLALGAFGLALGTFGLRRGRGGGGRRRLLHRHGPPQQRRALAGQEVGGRGEEVGLGGEAEGGLARDHAALLGAGAVLELQGGEVCSVALAQELGMADGRKESAKRWRGKASVKKELRKEMIRRRVEERE